MSKLTIEELAALHSHLLKHSDALEDAMGVEAFRVLEQVIARQFVDHKWTQAEKDTIRWALVCEGLDQYSWSSGKHYKYASEKLKGHPAEGQPSAMKWSYDRVQNKIKKEAESSLG